MLVGVGWEGGRGLVGLLDSWCLLITLCLWWLVPGVLFMFLRHVCSSSELLSS